MVDVITYRTADATRWGGGQPVDLTAQQIDMNFWVLASQLGAIQDHIATVADIDYFNVTGNLMYVHLTNHVVLGPYTLPTAQWAFKGQWTPATLYSAYDIVTDANATYMVLQPVTSDPSFDPGALSGGHPVYGLLIEAATNALPAGGTTAQRLAKIDDTDFNADWVTEYRNLALFVRGLPGANELLIRYISVDTALSLPIALAGSNGGCGVASTADAVFTLAKNGTTIGTVTFPMGSGVPVFSFTAAITLVAGDVLTVIAPASQDATLADVSLTLQAAITG